MTKLVSRAVASALVPLLATLGLACAGNLGPAPGGSAGSGGTSARGGTSGGAGSSGAAGASATAGTTGAAGTLGVAGTSGTAGASGGAGRGGTTGAAGTSGGAGRGGTSGTAGRGGTGGGSGTSGAAGRGGSTGTAGSGAAGRGGTTGAAGATGAAGTTGAAGSGTGGASGAWNAGNPNGSCSAGVPARGQPADVSSPTTVVGTGTAASCTFAALQTAVTKGGIITFNCGASPVTIQVTATLVLPSNKNTVIDGGRLITLDGGGAVQILSFSGTDWMTNTNGLTLQHLALTNAKETGTQMIPTAPAPCSQGFDDGQGGAVFMTDGNLTVIDCIFTNNHAAPLGPDTGGGAIYIEGSKNGAMIVSSTFTGNGASNAGAVGGLFAELDIYNSLFQSNMAVGHDANGDDSSMCSVINNNQHEVGSGGNGGAIYSDGNSVNVLICGDAILNNAAGTNAFGGGIFFTSNNFGGTLSIADSTITGNTGGHWTQVNSGSTTNAGTAVGTNCKSLTITNSTVQGVN
jgi:hypothetical protein